ncbi:MAG: cobalamin B12-binding domain-containing protein [Deltaproteobacteria bacterium]|nr:cobalamin B12-binding domain-containing protein [Deltaproteobacteria bacterium]
MRILLVYPNAKKEVLGSGDLGAVAEPIALEYVGAGARLDGHDVRLLDLRLHPEGLDEALRTFRPDVAGVTGYSMHVLRALEVCRRVKELAPGCMTVAGGHHATLEPIDFLEPEVDLVVAGEGVRPFRQILSRRQRGEPVPDVAGVWSRVGGTFRFGGDQEGYDLGSIPCPDRSLTAGDRHRYHIDWMRPIALIRTTVGCPFRCSFCSLWRIMGGHYVEREIDAVVEELRSIPERFVFFVDDEAFVDSKRMWALGRSIEKADLGKSYFAYSRVDSLLRDLDLMRFWHGIGLRRLFVGLETASEDELDGYNKRQKRDQIVRALEAASEIGISLFSNFIVSPSYTKREFEELIRFIEENDVGYPAFTVLTPIPGTGSSYDDVLERQPNGRPRWDLFDLQHAVTRTRMPPAAFASEYEGLYRRFGSRYRSSGGDLGDQADGGSEARKAACTRIALQVLGGTVPRPTGEE